MVEKREKEIALYFHRIICDNNKETGCCWSDEMVDDKDNWYAFEHHRYLKLSQKVLSFFTYNEIIQMIDFMTEF